MSPTTHTYTLLQTMRRISRQHVLMLTGTPVQNNLRELYALLTFMYPDLFTDPTLFETGFNLARNQVDDSKLEQAHYVSVGESVGEMRGRRGCQKFEA